jgi:hypothetical protein
MMLSSHATIMNRHGRRSCGRSRRDRATTTLRTSPATSSSVNDGPNNAIGLHPPPSSPS